MDSLYENVGGKIKRLAKWMFIVEAISAFIAGIVLAADTDVLYILLCIVGPIVAWVSSWVLYAFGELVEDVHAMRNKERSSIGAINSIHTGEHNGQQTVSCNKESSSTDTINSSHTSEDNDQQTVSRNKKNTYSFFVGYWVCPKCNRGNPDELDKCKWCETKKED